MNFLDMTKDEKMYYEQIRVHDDDLDKALAVLGVLASIVLIMMLIMIFG